MSFLDALFGGGSEVERTSLPGYLETPSKKIGWSLNWLLNNADQEGDFNKD